MWKFKQTNYSNRHGFGLIVVLNIFLCRTSNTKIDKIMKELDEEVKCF